MVSHNYRWWRSKREKPKIVQSEAELPEGNWVLVSVAAKAKGYSITTIMMRFYKSHCGGYKVGDGPLLVNLDEIK